MLLCEDDGADFDDAGAGSFLFGPHVALHLLPQCFHGTGAGHGKRRFVGGCDGGYYC